MISASPRRLSVFKCVVEDGGFNAAATRLGIAQPSVGAHIKALEVQLGQPLFYRQRGARPQLTEAGKALFAYTLDTLQRSADAHQAFEGLRRAQSREIVIGCHRDVASQFLAPCLAAFAGRQRKTRVVTRIGTIEDVLAMLRGNQVNLGILLAAGPVSGFNSDILRSEPLTVVVGRRHPLAKRKAVTTDELARHPFVTGLSGSRFAKLVAAALRQTGLDQYDVMTEIQESASVREIIRHGAGVACLPYCTVADDIAAKLLVSLDLVRPPAPLELRCVYRVPVNGTIAAFLQDLRATGRGE